MKMSFHSCWSFLGHIPRCGCVFVSASGECEQKKTVDLVKSGSDEEMNF